MCVIFTLNPGQMIPENKLENAIANNLHGYGVLMHPNGERHKLEVVRGFRTEGIDTEEVFHLLDGHRDYVRYVHLRNMTHGAVSEDNVHPFEVFKNDTRTVYMMHNGTFRDFKPSAQENDKSDTRVFGERFVTPLLNKFHGEWGQGDYNDPLCREIIKKYMEYGNRVLFVSNDLEPAYFGDWRMLNDMKVSNDLYFDKVVRGPRKVSSPFPAATPVTSTSGTTTTTQSTTSSPVINSPGTTHISHFNQQRPKFEPTLSMLKALGTTGSDIWDTNHFSMLSWIKDEELLTFIRDMDDKTLVSFIRDFANAIDSQENDMGMAEKKMVEDEEEMRELLSVNARLLKKIASLEAKVYDLENGIETIEQEAA